MNVQPKANKTVMAVLGLFVNSVRSNQTVNRIVPNAVVVSDLLVDLVTKLGYLLRYETMQILNMINYETK